MLVFQKNTLLHTLLFFFFLNLLSSHLMEMK